MFEESCYEIEFGQLVIMVIVDVFAIVYAKKFMICKLIYAN